MFDHSTAKPRQVGCVRGGPECGRVDHEVVMEVGHRSSPLTAGVMGEDAHREGLEVIRQEPSDEVATDTVAQEEPRRLECPARHDDRSCGTYFDDRRVGVTGEVEVADPGGSASRLVEDEGGNEGL